MDLNQVELGVEIVMTLIGTITLVGLVAVGILLLIKR